MQPQGFGILLSAGSVLTKYRRLERERTARAARLDLERQRAATKRSLAAAIARGDYETAVVVQAGLVEANKNDPKLWQDFATYLEKSGQLDKAATAIRRAALLSKKDAAPLISAMYRRDAAARAASGDLRSAIAQQAMAVEASNKDFSLWRELAGYLEKDGQIDHAATAYRRAHSLGGPNPDAKIFAMYQADVLAKSGSLGRRESEALPITDREVSRRPKQHRTPWPSRGTAQTKPDQASTRNFATDCQACPGDNAAKTKLAAIKGPDRSRNVPHVPFERSMARRTASVPRPKTCRLRATANRAALRLARQPANPEGRPGRDLSWQAGGGCAAKEPERFRWGQRERRPCEGKRPSDDGLRYGRQADCSAAGCG